MIRTALDSLPKLLLVLLVAFCLQSAYSEETLHERIEREMAEMARSGQTVDRLSSIAKLYEGLEDWENAAKFYFMASRDKSADASPTVELARMFVRAGKVQGALKILEEGTKAFPQSAEMFFGKGNVYLSLGDGRSAMRAMTRALSLDPENPLYRFKLADVCVGAKDYERAETLLEPLMELEDPSEDAVLLYALVLMQTERERRAVRLVEEFYERYPDSEKMREFFVAMSLESARAQSNDGRIGRAVKILEDSKEIVPSDPRILLRLAQLENEQGNPQQSIVYCREILAGDPDHLDALEFMGRMLRIEGQTDEADKTFRKALELARAEGDEEKIRVLDQLLNALN